MAPVTGIYSLPLSTPLHQLTLPLPLSYNYTHTEGDMCSWIKVVSMCGDPKIFRLAALPNGSTSHRGRFSPSRKPFQGQVRTRRYIGCFQQNHFASNRSELSNRLVHFSTESHQKVQIGMLREPQLATVNACLPLRFHQISYNLTKKRCPLRKKDIENIR